ncbi:hypothetical protein PIB30_014251 [Stylosanthes scabra]|uniref:Uncharacterized protein n=1 Tax=Stylosanthes scabra TaxID=79078 RepID=A0ABU6Y4S4_9FABA|nr:hypothetical protein [Stylosanthes scabra]
MSAEGSGRGRRAAGDGAQQNELGAANPNGLYKLNRSWHITGRERVLLPRRCVFMMPPPPPLMQYIRQAGFDHAVQLRDFCFDAALLSAFVERWRPDPHLPPPVGRVHHHPPRCGISLRSAHERCAGGGMSARLRQTLSY